MEYAKGLEGVIAGETAISNVEGDIGRLTYRGFAIEELVHWKYHEVMWLVLSGEPPTPQEGKNLVEFLAATGELNEAEMKLIECLPSDLHPMRLVQGLIPLLSCYQGTADLPMDEPGCRGLAVIARLPHLLAAFRARQLGREMPHFDPSAEYLENFLTMFPGADPGHVEVFSVTQILQMEHSFNAGTFAGRVTASTLAPVESVLSAAAGALYGRLHGRADEAALREAKHVGSPAGAQRYVEELLADKGRLMGMGHREYRVEDPRAAILKKIAGTLCVEGENRQDFETLEAIEAVFRAAMEQRGKAVWANVEYYKGAVFQAIGIPLNYFTAMFAMARSIGWLAHFMESRVDNRIIRPKALYTGAPYRIRLSKR